MVSIANSFHIRRIFLGPMPLTDFNNDQLPDVIACFTSKGAIDDKIIRAVAGPTPETEIN